MLTEEPLVEAPVLLVLAVGPVVTLVAPVLTAPVLTAPVDTEPVLTEVAPVDTPTDELPERDTPDALLLLPDPETPELLDEPFDSVLVLLPALDTDPPVAVLLPEFLRLFDWLCPWPWL